MKMSVLVNPGAGITVFTELCEVNSKAIKSGEDHKRNSCCQRNTNCNKSFQSNLLTGSELWAERAPYV